MIAGTPTSDVLPPGYIYITEDEGRTWTPTLSLDIHADEMQFDVDPAGGIIVALQTLQPHESYKGAFWSSDGGVTWTDVGPTNIRVNELHRTAGGILLAATNTGIKSITENGAVWKEVGLDTTEVLSLFSDDGSWYAGTASGLYVSDDGGLSWYDGGLNEEVSVIAFSNRGMLTVGTSRGLFFRSHGIWALSELTAEVFSFDSSAETGDWAATSDGLFRFAEESGFEKVAIEAPSVRMVRIIGSAVYAGTSQGLFKSESADSTWILVGMPDSKVRAVAFTTEGHLLAGTESGLFMSRDEGRSWVLIRRDLWIDRIATCPNGDLIIGAGSWGGVHRSSDNGVTWVPIGLAQVEIGAIACTSEAVVAVSDGRVFRAETGQTRWTDMGQGVEGGNVTEVSAYGGKLLLTADTGVFRFDWTDDSWVKLSTQKLDALEISVDGVLYGFRSQLLFRSDDGGSTWTSLEVPSTGWIESLTVAKSGLVYFGSSGQGVFESTNRGETWQEISPGLPRTIYSAHFASVVDLVVGPTGHLYAATDGYGVVRTSSAIAMVTSSEGVGLEQAHLSAYPNPFSTQVTIDFQVLSTADVELEVFDALGRRVVSLVDARLAPGKHQAKWLTNSSVSGTYFCRLVVGDLHATIPLVHTR